MKPEYIERTSRAVRAFQPLIDEGTVGSLAELAIRFAAFGPRVTRIIPGAKSVAQLDANIDAILKGPLPARAIEFIESVKAR